VNGYDATVGIVGAGPVGLTCALRLASFGVRSMVIESESGLVPQGSKACTIQGDVVEILDKVGCGAQIADEGVTWRVARTYVGGKQIRKAVHARPLGFGPFINVSQYRIEQVLLERLKQTPEAEVLWGHPVTALDQGDGEVCILAGGRRLRFRYLLACDGVRSTLRELTGVAWTGHTYADRFLITDIQADLPLAAERHFHYDPPFNPGRQLVILPQPGNVWRIDWQLPPDVDIDAERRTGALDRRIRAVIGSVPYNIEWLSTYRFHHRVVERFRIGDVFFAGDAAHALPPYGARGMNSGIQDADNLAWKLAWVLRGTADPGLLDTYHAERCAAAHENLQVTAATIQFMVPPSAARRMVRGLLLTVSRLGALRRHVNSGKMAEPFVYVDSPIIAEGELRGRFAPDRMVLRDGARVRLRTLLGHDFVLLCFAATMATADQMAERMAGKVPHFQVVTVIADHEPGMEQSAYLAGHWYLARPDGHIVGSGPLEAIEESVMALQRGAMARQPSVALCPHERPGTMKAMRYPAAIAAALIAVLEACAGRYGYHRDELYFLACGRHLAWGYPDQPPFVPAVARLMSALAPGSLVVLRLPSALAAGALVLLTALITRELGGGRGAQVLASAVTALAPVVIAAGHLLSTTSFLLPATALLCWIVIRILRGGDQRLWLAAGLVAGTGLLDSDLIAFLALALVAAMAAVGPRRPLHSGWFYAGSAIALAMWSPYLAWQASHGWPELAVAHSIAAGRSGTSAQWWLIVPEQFVLVDVYFAPVWIAGLVRLLRADELRWCRAFGLAYLMLAAIFMAAGGKPYYLSVMFPVLLAAGAQPAARWIAGAHAVLRRNLVAVALLLSVTVLPFALPIVPVTAVHDTPIVKLNYDAGETIGWPAFVQEIAQVYQSLPAAQRATAVVLTSNYGEAGAVDRFGAAYGLPSAYSRQNAFWYWGPPPDTAATVVAVGFGPDELGFCASRVLGATLDNRVGVANQEQGEPVWICTRLSQRWSAIWPSLRYLG
jgi:3-(3-hydroxy-phenyl)propionate hydroxylase